MFVSDTYCTVRLQYQRKRPACFINGRSLPLRKPYRTCAYRFPFVSLRPVKFHFEVHITVDRHHWTVTYLSDFYSWLTARQREKIAR